MQEIEIDEKKLKSFLQLKPTLEHTAMFFECSERTVERFIKKKYKKTFFQFRDAQMNNTRHALVQKALSEALKKNVNTTMLIFALKNLADWSDNNDVQQTVNIDNLIFEDKEEDE